MRKKKIENLVKYLKVRWCNAISCNVSPALYKFSHPWNPITSES